MNASSPLLEVERLDVRFDAEPDAVVAVDDVSFHVDRGETVGLVGESGAGKSVTSLAIMGLVPTPPGRVGTHSSIRFRGEELVGASRRRLRALRGRRMSMVFQDPTAALNPVLTIGAQIVEGLRAHLELDATARRRRAVELLREVGIPDPTERVHAYPHELSGGMQQRAVLAMALACEPDLLIADEPTTALDVTIQAQILELLSDLKERRSMAVLLIAHDLAVVGRLCDRVLVMYAGQIVESASRRSLFRRPRHPYTEGLLASVPGRELGHEGGGDPADGDRRRRRLAAIPGSPPAPDSLPRGCRFAPRCPYVWERCGSVAPPLLPVASQDPAASRPASRCWLVEEPSRKARSDVWP